MRAAAGSDAACTAEACLSGYVSSETPVSTSIALLSPVITRNTHSSMRQSKALLKV